jgi:hypothetical protein
MLLLVWYEMYYILHTQQRIKRDPMDLSHPILYHPLQKFLMHHSALSVLSKLFH